MLRNLVAITLPPCIVNALRTLPLLESFEFPEFYGFVSLPSFWDWAGSITSLQLGASMHPFHLTQPRIPTLQQRTEEFINVLAPVLASPAPTLKSLIMDYTSDLAPEWFDLLCEELKLFNGAIVKFPVLETLSLGCPASITDAFYATLETAPLITHLRFSQTQKIPLRAPIVPLATLKSL